MSTFASGAALTPLVASATSEAQVTFLKTLAGPSLAAMYPSGLAWDANLGRLVVADTGYDRVSIFASNGTLIKLFGTFGTLDGQFDTPRQVAVDGASNIYVADAGNSRIQKFDSNGTWLWTAGGVGTCPGCLNTPIGITFDPVNNVVIVADTGHSLIKAFTPAGAWAWSSPRTLGIASPREALRGPDGRIWVDDYHHQQIKAFDVTGAGVWTPTPAITLGDGKINGHGAGQLNFPYNVGFSLDAHTIYVADTGNNRIARWDISGSTPLWLDPPFGSRCQTPCPPPPGNIAKFQALRRVTVDTAGNIWAADFWGSGIHEFNPAGTAIFEIAGANAPAPGFAQAFGITVGFGANGTTYGVDRLNQRIERFDANGNYLNKVGQRGVAAGTFSWPETAAVAPDGTLWVGDTRNDRLQHFAADLSGTPTIVGGTQGSALGQFNYIEGVTVDAGGKVWVADSANNRIQTYDPSTATFAAFGSQGAGNGQFNNPEGVAVSSTNVYVADTLNNRIQELTLAGAWVASFSTGLNQPQGVALAGDGTLWVADSMNNRIVHLSASLTDMGDTFGSLGSGNMQFFDPHSLAVHGNVLFVADTFNNRVQEFTVTTTVGPAAKLAFTASPGNSTAGTPFATQPAVAVQDANGNTVTTDTSSVTLAIAAGTGTSGAVLTCTGGLSKAAVSGIATFSGCSIDKAGTGYKLRATDGSLTLAKSSAFNVSGAFTFTPTYASQIWNANGAASIYPDGGAVDAAGNHYITDAGNSRVMKLDTSNNLTVLYSTGLSHPRGLQMDPDGTHLWITDSDNSRLVEVDLAGNLVRTLGSTPTLKSPYGVVLDATNAYVADTYGYNVVAFTRSTGAVLWTQSTCSSKAFTRTRGIGWGSDGNLYVTDTDNNRIVVLNTAGGCVRTFGAGGTGNGKFKSPRDVVGDSGGGIWVADAGNYRIQHLTLTGTFIAATTGGYGSGPSQFASPQTIFADNGLIDVCDTYNYNIERFSTDGAGKPVYVDRIANGTPPAPGGFNGSWSVAYGPSGELYATDWFNHRIEKFNPNGSFALAFGVYGAQPGQIEYPRGVAVSADGSFIAVAQEANNIELFNSNGTYKGKVIPADGSGLKRPRQVSFAPDGTLWVADYGHNRVLHMDLTGTVLMSLTNGGAIKMPQGVVVDSAGNIFVTNSVVSSVQKFNSSGTLLATLATAGSGPGQVSGPVELALIGPVGNQLLLIADSNNDRVVALTTDGTPYTTFGAAGAGPGQFNTPNAVAYDAISGRVAVADFINNRVSLWDSQPGGSGTVSHYVLSPSPIAATGALTAGATVAVTVTALDSTDTPVANADVYLKFVPAAGGGSAAVGATSLGSSPQHFTASGGGVVSVTYTAPGSLPSGGTDTLTAQNAMSGATITASDTYTFASSSSVASYTFTPVNIAPPASLAASAVTSSVLTAKNGSGGGVPGAVVYLSFAQAAGGGSAKVGATALTSSPEGFTANGSGQVSITYTAPSTLPVTGTDSITAQDALSAPTVTKVTAYSFGAPAHYSLLPKPIAATGSLAGGSTVNVRLRVTDASGNPVAGAKVFLSINIAPGGASASVRGTALTTTPTAFTVDASGAVAIAYTIAASPPSSGTDTISAADAASSPTITATTTYTY